jgi:hypothetical protein
MNRSLFSGPSNLPKSEHYHPISILPSQGTTDTREYHRQRRLPPPTHRYDDDDTEDAEDEDEDIEMVNHQHRTTGATAANGNVSGGSRPGSSSRDSGANKKNKSKPTKLFGCSGYGDCTMQFTRSEHLARHIRCAINFIILTVENIPANVHFTATVGGILVGWIICGNI